MVLICLIMSKVEHFFKYMLVIWMSSLEKVNSGPLLMQHLGLMSSAPGNNKELQSICSDSSSLSCYKMILLIRLNEAC